MRKLVSAGIFFLLCACKKDTQVISPVQNPPVQEEKKAELKFDFKPFFNNEVLVYNRPRFYTNTFGDSLRISKFNYYISNIVLTKTGGGTFSEPESYHLIKHDEANTTSFSIKEIPEGPYSKIDFLIGVDEARSTSGSQTGDLDPANQMFWDWNTGYIYLKLEGEYKSVSTPTTQPFAIHIGGISATKSESAVKPVSFPLSGTTIAVTKGKTSTVYFNLDLAEMFKNPEVIDLDTYGSVIGGSSSVKLAKNYADMFSVSKIEN